MTEQTSGKKLRQPLFSVEIADTGYTVVRNSLLHDPSLSYTAKGVLLTCLSTRHSFNKEWIVAHGNEPPEVIRRAMQELLALGYLRRVGHAEACLYQFTDTPAAAPAPAHLPPPPRRRSSRPAPTVTPIPLESWLEPHRAPLERWLDLRLKEHPKLPREITPRSLAALTYARERGVLAEFCDLAAEATWRSLGFNGYKEYVDKLVGEKRPSNPGKPPMSAINYTLK